MEILFGLMPLFMFVVTAIFIVLFFRKTYKNAKKHQNKMINNEQSENNSGEDDINDIATKLKKLYLEKVKKSLEEQQYNEEISQNEINVHEEKTYQCKNCGATLEKDKHGKRRCPYCQSKYF